MSGLVNVLISTYNGEKYIEDQIQSIQAQTYPNICIHVRDDGSTDGTVDILKQYARRKEIKLYTGKNKGFGGSFLSLLRHAEDGDFWAFCDQDDIWLPDKVKWAVEWLEKQTVPALYGSSYDLTDERLQKTGSVVPPSYEFNFRRGLTDCLYQGFVMTINRPLREKMLACEDRRLESHDWWAVLLAEKFGKSRFDPRIAALHRRLDSSISVMTFQNRVDWFVKTFTSGNSSIKKCAKEYVRVYGANDRETRYASWFADDRYHLGHSLIKAFYPGRWRPQLSSEIVIRFLMLTGRI